jgi:mevalonate kinase
MSRASAPGKIILFGEHAVVYGYPALAVPVTQVTATVEVLDRAGGTIQIDAPDVGLQAALDDLPASHPLAAAIRGTLAALGLPSVSRGASVRILSTIPVASGLGSGAAVSVAIIRALSVHLGQPLRDEDVNRIAYEVEKLHHGTPSGIDNTVITYARPVFFVKGEPIETLSVGAPFTLVIADTGVPAPTKESVADVRRLWEADKPRWQELFATAGAISRKARAFIRNGNINELGPLMDANHALLQEMTVSSPELDRLVFAARVAGAAGAKLSGGGRGGNMIALVDPARAQLIADALKAAGAKNTIVTTIT